MPKTAQPQNLSQLQQTAGFAKEIITSEEHHVEVLASPGSGKTHTLIARLQYLLSSGVPAAQILVLSFSNEAVRELRRRMDYASTNSDATKASKSDEYSLNKVTVSTAHAFALSLIPRPPAIITDKMQRKLLAQSILMVRKRMRNRKHKKTIWKDISTAQRQRRRDQLEAFKDSPGLLIPRLLALFDYKRAGAISLRAALELPAFTGVADFAVIRAIYSAYRALKRNNDYQDFADILDAAETRLQCGRTRLSIQHILVDEFQDCSTAQTRLLALLARNLKARVMVFGDPAQSLYGFAGANYQTLSAFLPNTVKYTLPYSHRLTAETAALASAVLKLPASSAIKTRLSGIKPALVRSASQTEQARDVLADVQSLIANGAEPSGIAVLARTKATLHVIEATLLAANLDCNRIGAPRTNRHVLSVLRLVSWTARYRRLGQPVEPARLQGFATKVLPIDSATAHKQVSKLMRAKPSSTLEGQYKLCAQAYLRLLGGVRAHPDIRAQVNRWEPMCRQYDDARAMRAAVKANMGDAVGNGNCDNMNITTGTIHAAKGREWQHVLVVGVTEGILPGYRAKDPSTLEQERNLLYVAITRAKDSVRLYHAPTPHAKTRQTFTKLNRHLAATNARQLMTISKNKTNTVKAPAKAR
jgi:DNA helicase II / ATP-dependent DNA helicase PcrA